MLSNIEKCQLLAIMAHKGQKDKGGTPYINHPAWVAEHVKGEDEKCVAWLHDVIEDTDFTLSELKCLGLPQRVIEAVDVITKKQDEDYRTYILRVKNNETARKVKLEDLRHNMDLYRLGGRRTKKDLKRHKKYKTMFAILSVDGLCI